MNNKQESQEGGGNSENYSPDWGKIAKRVGIILTATTVFALAKTFLYDDKSSDLGSISLPTTDTLLAERNRVTTTLENVIIV